MEEKNKNSIDQQYWTEIIGSKSSKLNIYEIWLYRDLLILLVKRDFIMFFKQTILGPLWFVINPVFTTIIYMVIFGKVAKIPTDDSPRTVFYLAGIIIWNYFSISVNQTSMVFKVNSSLFSKVYFPRLIMPLAVVTSNLMQFMIQFFLFLAIVVYYTYLGQLHPNAWILYSPILIILTASLALAIGLILSSITAKYRDLNMLLSFGIQLSMYLTPIIYPASSIPDKYSIYIKLNPLTPIVECFRYAYLGTGSFNETTLIYSNIVISFLLIFGTLLFNRVQKEFIDSI